MTAEDPTPTPPARAGGGHRGAAPGWERLVVSTLLTALVLVVAVTAVWLATTAPVPQATGPIRDSGASVAAATPLPVTDGAVLQPRPRPVASPTARNRGGVGRDAARPKAALLARRAQREAVTVPPLALRIGTLNVLGSNHTRGSKRWAPGTVRSARQADLIAARGLQVIGLQEMQPDQVDVIQRQLPGYTMWPARALGPNGYRLQVLWRSADFTLVSAQTIMTPFSGMSVPLPYVLLRDNATQREFYVSVIHNSPRGMEAERDAATGQEIELFNRLLDTGVPVLTVGDMNERSDFFCRVAPATGMVSINGATATSAGCQVPAGAGIDWVMAGSHADTVSSSGFHRDPLPGLSDHPIVYGDVVLTR